MLSILLIFILVYVGYRIFRGKSETSNSKLAQKIFHDINKEDEQSHNRIRAMFNLYEEKEDL
jgi:D-alanyl-lipoteichoic acid acyltransferase DltB (MBOAT superfamily)